MTFFPLFLSSPLGDEDEEEDEVEGGAGKRAAEDDDDEVTGCHSHPFIWTFRCCDVRNVCRETV